MDKVLNRKDQVPLRRQLRNHPTAAEARLWSRLRGSQLGVKFRRQQGIGRYVVDFHCSAASLVIELDGDSHCTLASETSDAERQGYIEAQGLRVLRFRNEDVFADFEAVLMQICAAVAESDVPGNHP